MVFSIPAQHDGLFIGTVLVPHEIVANAGVVMSTTPTTIATILAKMFTRSMPSLDQDAPFVSDLNHNFGRAMGASTEPSEQLVFDYIR